MLCFMRCYMAFIVEIMTYSDKIIEHKATKETPKFNEVIATIELSEGDMMELQKILSESERTWGTQLIIEKMMKLNV